MLANYIMRIKCIHLIKINVYKLTNNFLAYSVCLDKSVTIYFNFLKKISIWTHPSTLTINPKPARKTKNMN